MQRGKTLVSTIILAASLAIMALPARADSFATYGDASVVSNGLQLTSDTVTMGAPGFGGVYLNVTSTLTLNDVTTLSTDYEMTQGTFGAGAPRFSIGDTNGDELYAYFGTPQSNGSFNDPNLGNTGPLANTGNYADVNSSDLRFQINGFGGVNDGYTYLTYAQVLAQVGTVQIGYITIDLDGGYSQMSGVQQIVVNNFTINNEVYQAVTPSAVPEPSSIVLVVSSVPAGLFLWRKRRRRAA